MELFGSKKKRKNKKKKIHRQKNPEKMCQSWSSSSSLFQCNLVDNQCQQMSEVLYTFTTNKYYAYLLNGEPSSFLFLKIAILSSMKLS